MLIQDYEFNNIDFYAEQLRNYIMTTPSQSLSSSISLLLIAFSLFIACAQCSKIITEYPLQDEYFDRIFKIVQTTDSKIYYLHLYCKEKNMLSISINENLQFQEHPRYSIHPPWKEAPNMQRKGYTIFEACNNIDYQVNTNSHNNQDEDEDFIVKIIRKNSRVQLFAIKDFQFKSKNHFTVETIDYSSKWGLGERFQKNFHVTDGFWTVWNRDRPWEIDHGSRGKSGQTYGHQPVYLAKQNSNNGKFHLVYFKNTFGFNFESKSESQNIIYTVTGGNIHFLLITGEQPESILQQYHTYIGKSHLPPFWSLGYHQSRWGYKSIHEVQEVVRQFDTAGLPLQTIWSDLDYMDRKAIFTIDKVQYPPEKVRKLLKQKNLHYIPLIDVGISLADTVAVDKGKYMKVFFPEVSHSSGSRITYSSPPKYYRGKVWPGDVHYVDYLHPNATEYWQSQLDRLHQEIPFSGIWLDMNEPSNFNGNQATLESFRIQHSESINMMTINVDLKHFQIDQQPLKHAQVHAYYGHMSTLPTHSFLKKHSRPFIISRSNSVGSGAYAGHWTGDNVANWDFLRLSISGNFLFQIFGIHMVGADICGFRGNTNEHLCSRWMQVGSMYPFARNHNQNQSISQQPYRFGPTLTQTFQLSFMQRYALLKQMYATMVILNGTGSFYRPLIFQYYNDKTAYTKEFIQTEFMIGDYLLGAPIVQQFSNQRTVYFPGNDQIWYQLKFDQNKGFDSGNIPRIFKGRSVEMIQNKLPSAPPLFLRGGKLIFVNKPKTRTSNLDSNFTVYVGLNQNGSSNGHFLQISDFNDEQNIEGCLEKGCKLNITIIQAAVQGGQTKFFLKWKKEGHYFVSNKDQNRLYVDRIIIFSNNKILRSKPGVNIVIGKESGSVEFTATQ